MTSHNQILLDLGWSPFFEEQLAIDETLDAIPLRVSSVHRIHLNVIGETGTHTLTLPKGQSTGEFAVGDWVMADRKDGHIHRLLERKSLLKRLASGSDNRCQLIASNIDTLFIVSSCNADFRVEWFDLFLALAFDAGVEPVIVLTKTDSVENSENWVQKAKDLADNVSVIGLDAREESQLKLLDKWCARGQTAAMVGSSGVGKSTLLNGLSGLNQATAELSKKVVQGRHTTTARSLHQVKAGGWLVDTPGIRGLRLHEGEAGIDALFPDVADLADQCHFRDCSHDDNPGCAIQKALHDESIDADRVKRWFNLRQGDKHEREPVFETTLSKREQRKIDKANKKNKKKGIPPIT
ncbi:MAG: ribosome small subunit-dependent GTPase A [Sneathiella sp.]